jgi:hypothetical protein
MKKLLLFVSAVALAALLVFAFAACGDDDGEETTLTITNLSDYDLRGVEFRGTTISDWSGSGIAIHGISSGSDATSRVRAGTGYVFFRYHSQRYRITEALTCEKDIATEITINNQTMISTVGGSEQTGGLKSILDANQ